MPKLKLISLWFLLLMLVQVIPIQQIGNALSQNQWTEELPHSTEIGVDDISAKAFLPVLVHDHSYDAEATSVLNYIHQSDRIPSHPVTDVVSPPPDLLS